MDKIKNTGLLNKIKETLDKGEAEAIVLALELNADLLLIDEKLGRQTAEKIGIKVSGTIGVLIKAKQKGIIKEVKPFIYELIVKGNFYKDSFIKMVLEYAKEL